MSGEPPGSQLNELLRRLSEARVRFVVVGGLAVLAWGYVRSTDDIDIVPDPDPDNLDRLVALLERLGGRVKVGEDLLAASAISTFVHTGDLTIVATELGRVDVLQGLPTVPSYATLNERAHEAEIGDVTVRICSLGDLREMKRAAGRPVDVADLEALAIAHDEPADDEIS